MSNTWWPAASSRNYVGGALGGVGSYAYYWSSTRYTSSPFNSYYLNFYYSGSVNPSNADSRSGAFSVRCVQERGALRVGPGTWERFGWDRQP